MNRKSLTMILGVVLIAGFFLPYLSASIFSMDGISGLDMVKGAGKADKYLFALAPLAGLLLLVGAANGEKYTPSRGILAILALVGVLYLPVRWLIEGLDFGLLLKGLGLGFWLSLISSLALVFYSPRS